MDKVVIPSDGPARKFWRAEQAEADTFRQVVAPRRGIVATASFTPAAAAYSANDLIGLAQPLAFTFADDGGAIPAGALIRINTSLLKIDQAAVISGETSYILNCFGVTPPTAFADNDAWTVVSANLAALQGAIALGTPLDIGGVCFVKTAALNAEFRPATDRLFGLLQTVGPFTATAVARQVTLFGEIL